LPDLNTPRDPVIPGWTLYTARGATAGFYYGNGDLNGVRLPYRLTDRDGRESFLIIVRTFTWSVAANRFETSRVGPARFFPASA
jgi:hypothetical protein